MEWCYDSRGEYRTVEKTVFQLTSECGLFHSIPAPKDTATHTFKTHGTQLIEINRMSDEVATPDLGLNVVHAQCVDCGNTYVASHSHLATTEE